MSDNVEIIIKAVLCAAEPSTSCKPSVPELSHITGVEFLGKDCLTVGIMDKAIELVEDVIRTYKKEYM